MGISNIGTLQFIPNFALPNRGYKAFQNEVSEMWRMGKVVMVFRSQKGQKLVEFYSWPPATWVTLCILLIKNSEIKILVDGVTVSDHKIAIEPENEEKVNIRYD